MLTSSNVRQGLLLLTLLLSTTAFGQNNAAAPAAQAPAAPAAQAAPAVKSPIEEFLGLEAKHLDNVHHRVMIHRDTLLNNRIHTGNQWLEVELAALRRLAADQAKDLKTFRDQRAKIETQRRQVLSVLNGNSLASNRTALVKTMLQATPSDDLVNLLSMQINSIPAEYLNPESGSVIATTLQRDGKLVEAPRMLVGVSAAEGIGREALAFQAEWEGILNHVRNGNSMSHGHVQRLEVAVADWRNSAEFVLVKTPLVERVSAKRYLEQVSGLVTKVKRPEGAAEIESWIRGDGFLGGTLGELVQYLVNRRFTLRYGSEPHLALQKVGVQWVQEMDRMIARLEEKETKAVAASPANNDSALKNMLKQQNMDGNPAGLKK